MVGAVRSIADALDDNPYNSALWREYRMILQELTGEYDTDEFENLLAQLQSPPRDPEED